MSHDRTSFSLGLNINRLEKPGEDKPVDSTQRLEEVEKRLSLKE